MIVTDCKQRFRKIVFMGLCTPFFNYCFLIIYNTTNKKMYHTLHYLHGLRYLQHSTILRFCFLLAHTEIKKKDEERLSTFVL